MEREPSQTSEATSEGTPLSAKPNAEHFPNTVKLMKARRDGSKSPDVSPERARQSDHDVSPQGGDEADAESPSSTRDRKKKPNTGARTATAARVHEKLEEAKVRREEYQQERAQQLRRAEQHRLEKIRVQREMRQQALHRFVNEAPGLLIELRQAGLSRASLGADLDAGVVQHILMTDPRVCEHCGESSSIFQRICPHTNKPHRRRLVMCAEKLLKLIGETRVNLVPRRDAVGEAALAVNSSKARRGIAVNPQIFMLAYYNAAKPVQGGEGGEDVTDPLLHAAAGHLVDIVDQMAVALSSVKDDVETTVKPLLVNFAKSWRQYARIAEAHTSEAGERSAEERNHATAELLQATITAAVDFEHRRAQLRRDPDTPADIPGLDQYALMLRERAAAIGGPEGLAQLEAAVKEAVEGEKSPVLPAVPANTPAQQHPRGPTFDEFSAEEEEVARQNQPGSPIQPSAPVLPRLQVERSTEDRTAVSTAYTSGSETDVGRDERLRRAPMGPELPPGWYVDAQGISRPPAPPSKEELERQKFKQLEHRAKTAHQVRVPVFKDTTQGYVDEAAEARKQFAMIVDDAMWKQFAEELAASPPKVHRVPQLLRVVCDRLIDGLPKRIQARVGQEMRDVLDWDMIKYRIADPKHLADLMRFVVRKLVDYGAPARQAPLEAECDEIAKRLETMSEPLSVTVVEMFKFMLRGTDQLRDDLNEFQLAVLSSEIAQRASEYQQDFTKECLPPPEQWRTTLSWLRAAADDLVSGAAAATAQPGAQSASSSTNISGVHVKDVAYHGLLTLLASAGTTGETRWTNFPQEVLYFDKAHIFTASNLTQLFTLRLMIVSTVQMMLAQRRVPNVQDFLVDLDRTLVSWFATTSPEQQAQQWSQQQAASKKPVTLPQVKEALIDEVNMYLAHRASNNSLSPSRSPGGKSPATSQPTANLQQLLPAESDSLKSIVEKMVDTTSMQYSIFEKRVIGAYKDLIASRTFEGSSPTFPQGEPPACLRTFATIPALQKEVWNTARDLNAVLAHHWETYKPQYTAMWTHILENPMAPESSEGERSPSASNTSTSPSPARGTS